MKNSKSIIAIILLFILVVIMTAFIFYGNKFFNLYVQKISEKRELVRFLEKNKQSFDLYKKILVQGSVEQDEVAKYVLSAKTSFTAISKIEADLFKTGLASKEKGGLVSVNPRENADLVKYGAREIVITLEAQGPYNKVSDYIRTLDYLPYVSHIEKVDFQFLERVQTTTSLEGPAVTAKIFLVIIETNESKK